MSHRSAGNQGVIEISVVPFAPRHRKQLPRNICYFMCNRQDFSSEALGQGNV